MRIASVLTLALLAACAGGENSQRNYGRRPDWSVTLPDGKKVSASDYDSKVVMIDFWATWCPPCRQEIPGFISLQDKYRDKGLAIVGFSFDNDPKDHEVWIKEQKLNYRSIYMNDEAGRAVVDKFQDKIGEIAGFPTTIVIDRAGTIVYKHTGFGSVEDFENVIVPLLAEAPPATGSR